jgi:hypothetical protein
MATAGVRRRIKAPDKALLPLLVALGRFRCASAKHLRRLALGGASDAAVKDAIDALIRDELVQSVDLPLQNRGYSLTERAVRGLPELRARFSLAVAQADDLGRVHGWQRAALWTAYVEQGYHVGCGPAALAALRTHQQRHLEAVTTGRARHVRDELWSQLARELGESAPLATECRRCRQRLPEPSAHAFGDGVCEGPFRAVDACPVDVAYRQGECVLLVADRPFEAIQTQLRRLPLHVSDYDRDARAVVYLPKLPVVFVPCEEDSTWDPRRRKWRMLGTRLRKWMSYTEGSHGREVFPYRCVMTNKPPPDTAVLFRTPASRMAHAYGAMP